MTTSNPTRGATTDIADPSPMPGDTLSGRAFGIAYRSPEQIQAHPGFRDACYRLLQELLDLYGEDRRLIRGLVEYSRAVSFMVIICLDAMYVPDDDATHVTLRRLIASLRGMHISGDRRIRAFVESLESDGFLTRASAPGDARAHILRPTEKMLAADRAWLAAFHAPLMQLYGDPLYDGAVRQDPAYQAAYRRNSVRTYEIAWKIMSDNPLVFYFLDSETGFRILVLLMRLVRDEPSRRSPPGFYTMAAERSAVSRTHVRNILRGAAERGIVALSDPPGAYVEVLPALDADFDRWAAMSLSAVDLVCRLATADLDGRGLNPDLEHGAKPPSG